MLLVVGIGVVPVGKDEGVVGQVGDAADGRGIPTRRVVELRILIDRRNPSVRRDDGEESESTVDIPKVRH